MYAKYGKVQPDGLWATLPDGSKMRYIPNFQFMKDMVGKEQITRRMKLQIQMHYGNRTFPIQIKDLSAEVEVEGKNQTIGNLVLEEMCVETKGEVSINEPFFRHFVQRWTPNPETKEYEIAVHQHMSARARQKLKTFATDLVEKYGDSI